ncbi:hypothetical protein Glove_52g52 [Diversispora epigaea]|uniref:Uncharacterized protein n=1 Tax=Diversispora epigaea TaxID=1348612 RepID=A0A397JPF1_9GLOM|nr:hypothetical protein Glove_52g52 [Diversispora epigaea]
MVTDHEKGTAKKRKKNNEIEKKQKNCNKPIDSHLSKIGLWLWTCAKVFQEIKCLSSIPDEEKLIDIEFSELLSYITKNLKKSKRFQIWKMEAKHYFILTSLVTDKLEE